MRKTMHYKRTVFPWASENLQPMHAVHEKIFADLDMTRQADATKRLLSLA